MPTSTQSNLIFFLVWCVGSVAVFVNCWLVVRRMKRTGPNFPPLVSVDVRFRERRASGRALTSLKTRLGGANNALDVIVTDDELWLTSFALFGFMAAVAQRFDLLHRVPLERVEGVMRRKSVVRVRFYRESGEPCEVELRLKKPERFVEALGFASENVGLDG